jgi:hypothetical protein
LLTFKTREGVIVEDYREKVVFSPLDLMPARQNSKVLSKLGGKPTWIMSDESPSTYENKIKMVFLMQLEPDFEFDIRADALPQMDLDLGGKPIQSEDRFYKLFLGNSIYFFGTEPKKDEGLKVYVITQID